MQMFALLQRFLGREDPASQQARRREQRKRDREHPHRLAAQLRRCYRRFLALLALSLRRRQSGSDVDHSQHLLFLGRR